MGIFLAADRAISRDLKGRHVTSHQMRGGAVAVATHAQPVREKVNFIIHYEIDDEDVDMSSDDGLIRSEYSNTGYKALVTRQGGSSLRGAPRREVLPL